MKSGIDQDLVFNLNSDLFPRKAEICINAFLMEMSHEIERGKKERAFGTTPTLPRIYRGKL